MAYEPFYERFPDLGWKETRTLTTIGHPDLPDDEYGLVEAYCNDRNCDCRRVFFNVASRKQEKIVAVIAYGWESRDFYVRWFGNDDPDIIQELMGPALNRTSRQSRLAPALLEAVTEILKDPDYVARLKRHYKMFKETVDGPARRRATTPPRRRKEKRKR